MVSVVKEICIFIIIAQAVLFFVPGASYVKYVRILIGMIMIMRILEPLFSLFVSDETGREIKERVALFEQEMEKAGGIYEEMEWEIRGSETEIYESMEEEVKRQLEGCESGYEIRAVKFGETVYQGEEGGQGAGIIITVREKKPGDDNRIYVEQISVGDDSSPETDKEALRETYAKQLGVDAGQIEICMD